MRCRSTVVALLDIVDNIRACGPVWSFLQFPMERVIGTLPPLICLRRRSTLLWSTRCLSGCKRNGSVITPTRVRRGNEPAPLVNLVVQSPEGCDRPTSFRPADLRRLCFRRRPLTQVH